MRAIGLSALGAARVDDCIRGFPAALALPFVVLYWKETGHGMVAAFNERSDADDWARQTAHSDLHTDVCERVYAVVARDSGAVLVIERCRGGVCRCGAEVHAP